MPKEIGSSGIMLQNKGTTTNMSSPSGTAATASSTKTTIGQPQDNEEDDDGNEETILLNISIPDNSIIPESISQRLAIEEELLVLIDEYLTLHSAVNERFQKAYINQSRAFYSNRYTGVNGKLFGDDGCLMDAIRVVEDGRVLVDLLQRQKLAKKNEKVSGDDNEGGVVRNRKVNELAVGDTYGTSGKVEEIRKVLKDPISMFSGGFVPFSLRQSQELFIGCLEDSVTLVELRRGLINTIEELESLK